jgi:MFS family permease
MKKLNTIGQYTLLCIASLTIMVGSVIVPGLISISSALGVVDNAILLVTLPALGAVIFAPIAGMLIDKYGAYKSLISGLFLYGFLGMSVYCLHDPTFIFTNRIMLGGATSLVMAGCTVLISQWYFGQACLEMIAKQGMAIELGGVLFLFLGGFLASHYWALPLSLYLLAWVFLVMLLLFVPRKHPAIEIDGSDKKAVFDKGFSLKSLYLIAVLSMVTFFTAIVLLPSTMHGQAYSEQQVGLLLAFISLVAVVAAYFMPKMVNLFGEQKVLALAFIFYSASYICFLQTGTAVLLIGAFFSGIGFGFSIPLLNHMTVERSDDKLRGRNLSYFTMSVFSGQFLTSFMKYIPGGTTHVFISCITYCVLIALILFIKIYKTDKKISGKTA